MAAGKRPRFGSLQIYPRKRVSKLLPSVNWATIKAENEGILGFIVYKVGMATAIVKDTTEKSMTFSKKITMPVTILEAPNMKVFSVRFYKYGLPVKDIVVSNDKELKRKLKVPKSVQSLDNAPQDYDDIKLTVYSLPKQTGIKKTPDIIEVAVNSKNKLEFIKHLISKEITLKDFLKFRLVDVRGVTRGKGNQGPVKRFGISLKSHKTEKGVRRPGSLGPWLPRRVTFRVSMAGQTGLHTRVHYNQNVIYSSTIKEKDINPKSGFNHYGKINTSYILLKGSVQGPQKRQALLTPAFRPTKMQSKKKQDFLEVITKTI